MERFVNTLNLNTELELECELVPHKSVSQRFGRDMGTKETLRQPL